MRTPDSDSLDDQDLGLRDLIIRARQQDPRAGIRLHDVFAKRLAAFIRSQVPGATPEDVEVIMQETLLRVLDVSRPYKALQTDAQARSWIFMIARNLVREAGRRRKSGIQTRPLEFEVVDDRAEVRIYEALEDNEFQELLRQAIASLGELHRDALCAVDDDMTELILAPSRPRTVGEVMQKHGVAQATVYAWRRQARMHIAQVIHRDHPDVYDSYERFFRFRLEADTS